MISVRLKTWGRALAALMNRKAGRGPRKPHRAPLTLETLEARVVPTTALLVATSFFDSAVYEFDFATGVQVTLVAPYSSSLLSGPSGLTVGPDGNLYISSQDLTGQHNDAILQYNLSTGALSTFIPSSVLEPIATAAGDDTFAPAGLRFGPDSNIYVSLNGGQGSTGGGEVIKFGIVSGAEGLGYDGTFSAVATGLVQPTGLTFGTAASDTGNLYVSNTGLQDVVKITGATTATPTSSTFVAPGSGGLNFPSGLTWGPDGKFYLVDLGATSFQGNVLQYNDDGSFSQVFTPTDPSDPGNLLFQFPSDALFDAQGQLLTANLGPAYPPNLAGSINEYNSDGSFSQVLVASSQFPDLGTGTSGISASQLALLSSSPPPSPGAIVQGTLSPGTTATPRVLTVGSVTFNPGSIFAVALNGATGDTGYGQLVSTGTVNLTNATLSVSIGYTAADQLDIVSDNAHAVVGTFLGLPEGSTLNVGGQLFTITYHGGTTGNDVVLTSVPPGTPFDVTVIAVDAFGNVDTNYRGTVAFTTTDPDPGVLLPPNYTFQSSDAGTVTFSGELTLFTTGTPTLTVTDLDSEINGSITVTIA